MRRPHILFIVNWLYVGGAERHLVELVRRGVATQMFSADVVCLKTGGDAATRVRHGDLSPELQEIGILVHNGWLRYRYDPRAVSQLLRLVAHTRPDLIYTHSGVNEMVLALVARVTRGIPTVCAVHTTKNASAGERFSVLQRMLMRRASAVVSVAPSHCQYLLASERLDPSRTVFICNGVDEQRFLPRTGPRLELVPGLAGRRVVGLVGSLLRDKGHHVLLEAMPRVLETYSDFALAFIGSEPDGRQGVEIELREQARKLGLTDRVVFLPYQHDMHRVLHGLDVLVLPSLPGRETFSVAVLEAMACGLPVLITRVGSMCDMVVDGQEGFLVEPNDCAALANRLTRLLTDPELAATMGAAGRRRIEQRFTLNKMVDAYVALFVRLVQGASPVEQRPRVGASQLDSAQANRADMARR